MDNILKVWLVDSVKVSILIALVIVVMVSSVNAVDTDSVFRQLVSTDASKAESTMILSSTELTKQPLNVRFNKAVGGVDSYQWLLYQSVPHERPIFGLKEVCTDVMQYDNKTNISISTIRQCKNIEQQIGTETYYINEYAPFNTGLINGEWLYKLVINPIFDRQKKGYALDWIASTLIDGVLIEKKEWDWLNATWLYARDITLNSTVISTLIDFPAYFVLDTYSLINSNKMLPNCADIRVTNSTGSLLLYDVETCNATNTVIWVKIPLFAGNSLLNVTIYYGNNLSSNSSNPTAVFSNKYMAVYHNSLNNIFGTDNLVGTGTWVTVNNVTACKLGECLRLNPDGYAKVAATSNMPVGTSSSTMSAWIKIATLTDNMYIFSQGAYSPNDARESWVTTASLLSTDVYGQAPNQVSVGDATALTYYAMRYANGTLVNSYNGTMNNNYTGNTFSTTQGSFIIGHANPAIHGSHGICGGNLPQCYIDEIRVSNTSRSDDWLTAEYRQLYSVGVELEAPLPNTAPDINNITIIPTLSYTDTNLNCTAKPTDTENSTLIIDFAFWVNGVNAGLPYNNSVICTNNTVCGSSELITESKTHFDNWTCAARSYDGSLYSNWKNTTKEISNSLPYWGLPLVNRTTDNNTAFSFFISALDNDATDTITYGINDTRFFIDSASGEITNKTLLSNGSYYITVNATDNYNVTTGTFIIFNLYTEPPLPPPDYSGGLHGYDLTTIPSVMLLFIMVIMWLGCDVIGFMFQNPPFVVMGQVIGILLGFVFWQIHPFFTVVLVFINTALLFLVMLRG